MKLGAKGSMQKAFTDFTTFSPYDPLSFTEFVDNIIVLISRDF